jgi:hypothetical protein
MPAGSKRASLAKRRGFAASAQCGRGANGVQCTWTMSKRTTNEARWSCARLVRLSSASGYLRLGACGVALALAGGCTTPTAAPPAARPTGPAAASPTVQTDAPCDGGFGRAASLALDKRAVRQMGASERLIAKLDSSAYRYFRLLGGEVAARTCHGFRDVRWHLPLVAIHGDAHVEQFVVTKNTFGLEDYDQAGFGPAVVDIVRYAASLHVACRAAPWPCGADAVVGSYFAEYRAALDRAPERRSPKVVERLRSKAPRDNDAWLRWAESLMRPLPADAEDASRRAFADFARIDADVRPERPARFYDVVRVGTLEMGIGSAMEKKLLFRVRGASEAADDDLVLEARSSPASTGSECAWRPGHGGSLNALLFMSVLGPRMPEVYGFAQLDPAPGAREFWVQSWDPGYQELSLGDIEGQSDLVELAEDAARQLAGHFWTRFPEQLRAHQRHAQLRAFDLVEARARRMSRELADEAVAGWESFRRAP